LRAWKDPEAHLDSPFSPVTEPNFLVDPIFPGTESNIPKFAKNANGAYARILVCAEFG
jgi:hypothetical protein